MTAEIGNFQEAEGLSDEDMAALLSERLGRTITEAGYKIIKGRRNPPIEWLDALSISPREPGASPPPPPGSDAGAAQPGERRLSALPFEPRSAHMQIMLIYTFAGKGAAMALKSPPVETLWATAAPEIATAYIEWAAENETVAKYIAALTLGGPAGKLVILHSSLVISTLIAAGKVDARGMVPPGMRAGDAEGGEDHGTDDAQNGARAAAGE